MNCAVVIPIFRDRPNKYEAISLERLYKVFKGFPIVFVSPKGLDLGNYKLSDNSIYVTNEEFQNHYFDNIEGYNRLLCASKFYKRLMEYDYILIAQLDTYIFRDELLFWCGKGYDYIGAPWFDISIQKSLYKSLTYSKYPIIKQLKKSLDFSLGKNLQVGNGGLSLRKVNTFFNYSKWMHFLEPNIRKYGVNEDIIWSILVPKYFRNFKIATFSDALKFSFDSEPAIAYKMNNDNLPFGCHGWSKDENISFWYPTYINEINS